MRLQGYFDENALRLVRALVTGGGTSELCQVLADGSGLPGSPTGDALQNRRRAKIRQFSLFDGPFAEFGVNCSFNNCQSIEVTSRNLSV